MMHAAKTLVVGQTCDGSSSAHTHLLGEGALLVGDEADAARVLGRRRHDRRVPMPSMGHSKHNMGP